jgi:hypothetical protein
MVLKDLVQYIKSIITWKTFAFILDETTIYNYNKQTLLVIIFIKSVSYNNTHIYSSKVKIYLLEENFSNFFIK